MHPERFSVGGVPKIYAVITPITPAFNPFFCFGHAQCCEPDSVDQDVYAQIV
jgi:hypothetical protein